MGKANPNRMNGVNKVVNQLITKQTASGKNVSLWGFTKSPTINYEERNFKTVLFLDKGNIGSIDKKFIDAIKKLENTNAVFHFHGAWNLLFFKLAKIIRSYNLEYVVTPHGGYNEIAMNKSKLKKKIYFNLFEKNILRFAKGIHCIGESEIQGLTSIYKTDKTVLLPYGMEFQKLNQQKFTPTDVFVFGYVGRLDIHTKGLDLMLKAFAMYFKNDEKVELWIIGGGADKDNLEDLIISLGLSINVKLLGPKYGNEKDLLIQQMNVFLHPSRNEGMPSAVIEAASFGVPSIVSKATNIGSYIQNNNAGLVVENNNIEQLALSMQYFTNCQSDVERQMGSNALKMIETDFNWNRIVNDFDKLYA